MKLRASRKLPWAVALGILLLFLGEGLVFIRANSQTADEAVHLTAGYSYLKTGDFRLLPSHPPLAELLCALPLLAFQPEFAPSAEAWRAADEYAVRPT